MYEIVTSSKKTMTSWLMNSAVALLIWLLFGRYAITLQGHWVGGGELAFGVLWDQALILRVL